jgi:hypothetical protein
MVVGLQPWNIYGMQRGYSWGYNGDPVTVDIFLLIVIVAIVPQANGNLAKPFHYQ